jgi:hypothetical protein
MLNASLRPRPSRPGLAGARRPAAASRGLRHAGPRSLWPVGGEFGIRYSRLFPPNRPLALALKLLQVKGKKGTRRRSTGLGAKSPISSRVRNQRHFGEALFHDAGLEDCPSCANLTMWVSSRAEAQWVEKNFHESPSAGVWPPSRRHDARELRRLSCSDRQLRPRQRR